MPCNICKQEGKSGFFGKGACICDDYSTNWFGKRFSSYEVCAEYLGNPALYGERYKTKDKQPLQSEPDHASNNRRDSKLSLIERIKARLKADYTQFG